MLNEGVRPGSPGYRVCAVTVMDTTDPDISFDENGVSNWVRFFENEVRPRWTPEGDPARYRTLVDLMKKGGRGREYDCILGVSGGVDSSYLAYLAAREGLRPLLVHTDAGWNSEVAVGNIESIVRKCGFDLATVVVDWDQMAELQKAFLRAGVPNQDIPQDHVIFAALYRTAQEHRIQWVLSGHNFACESILPPAWGHTSADVRHIKAIFSRFGRGSISALPLVGSLRLGLVYTLFRGMRVAKPLDLLPYDKRAAMRTLQEEFGWRYYGAKHFESRWTRYFQGHWLPTRFGYDKRRAHLSSEILSGQITRQEALRSLETSTYTPEMVEEDVQLILRKLRLSPEDWEHLLGQPLHAHDEYPTATGLASSMRAGRDILRRLGLFR